MAKRSKPKSAAAADATSSGAAASTDVNSMLIARLDAMQNDFKLALADITTTAKSYQQTAQVGSIATKLDVGSDESQAAGIVLSAENKRSYDNAVAFQALRFEDRSRVHFDNMQAITALAYGNIAFAIGLCQNLAVVDAHQQCGKNAVSRSEAK